MMDPAAWVFDTNAVRDLMDGRSDPPIAPCWERLVRRLRDADHRCVVPAVVVAEFVRQRRMVHESTALLPVRDLVEMLQAGGAVEIVSFGVEEAIGLVGWTEGAFPDPAAYGAFKTRLALSYATPLLMALRAANHDIDTKAWNVLLQQAEHHALTMRRKHHAPTQVDWLIIGTARICGATVVTGEAGGEWGHWEDKVTASELLRRVQPGGA